MHRIAILIVVIALATVACAGVESDMQASEASDVESTLRTAGFRLIPADTPARIDSMRTLPPLAFSRVMREDRAYFVYADPRSCLCLWVGTAPQMQHYARLAEEEQLGAIQDEFEDVALQMDLWEPDWPGDEF